jgi:uncharacterized protein YndB with AHSA1/START domain
MPVISRSVDIQARPSTVWNLLSTQEGMRRWLEPEITIDMRVGGDHRHINQHANQLITGKVLEIVPEKQLVLSWFEEGGDWVNPIRLVFTLEEIPGGTRVTMQWDGFAGIGKPAWERTMKAYEIGTERHGTLEALKRAAEAIHAA